MMIPGESSKSDDVNLSQTTAKEANFSSVHASSTYSSIVSLAGSKLRKQLQGKLNEHAAMPLTSNNSKAYQQLEKLGWKKGEAVGKRKIGLTTHVRIEPRMTQAGLGAKSASTVEALQYDQHSGPEWWKHNVADTLAKLQNQNSSKTTTKLSKKKKSRSHSPQSIIIDEIEEVVNDNNEQNQMSERELKKLKKLQKKEKKDKRKKMKNCEMDAADNDNNDEGKAPADKKHIFTDEELFAATGGVRFSMRAGKTRNLAKWKRTENYDDVKTTTTESLKNKELLEETSGSTQINKSDEKSLKRKRNNAVEGELREERNSERNNDDRTNVVKSNEAEKDIAEKNSQSVHHTLVQISNDEKKKKEKKEKKRKTKRND